MQYLISENGNVHGFLVTETCEDKVAAEHRCKELNEKYCGYDHKVNEVEILSEESETADYCEDRTTIIVTVKAVINGAEFQERFHVQTIDGVYDAQQGCWITTDKSGEDRDFTDVQVLIFEAANVVKTAEAYLNAQND